MNANSEVIRLRPLRRLLLAGVWFFCALSAWGNPFSGQGAQPPAKSLAQPAAPVIGLQAPAWILDLQKGFHQDLGRFLRQAGAEGFTPALFFLLLSAFLYGVFHTLLPGHQKAVISAYFLSETARYRDGLWAGLLFALFHAFSSVTIILLLRFVFQLSSGQNLDAATFYTQLFSSLGVIVIGIGLFIVKVGSFGRVKKELELARIRTLMGFDFQAKIEKAVSTISWKRFVAILFFAGLLPCPGSLLVLLFALSLGHTGLGVLSVLFISLGMAVTLTALALVVIFLKRRGTDLAGSRRGRLALVAVELAGTVAVVGFSLLLLPWSPPS